MVKSEVHYSNKRTCGTYIKTSFVLSARTFSVTARLRKAKFCISIKEISPVLNMLSLTSTLLDELMWTASVLGLEAGAMSLRWDAKTRMQLVNAICIFWLLASTRSRTFKFLHL